MYIQQFLSLIAFLRYTRATHLSAKIRSTFVILCGLGEEEEKNNKSAVFSEFTPPQG